MIQRLRSLGRLALAGFKPRSSRYLREIRQSGLFDRQFYRSTNPGLNLLYRALPERHFILFGELEGRRPNPEFSPGGYLRNNPDLVDLAMPPFLHYLRSGRYENRITRDLPPPKVREDVPVPVLRPRHDGPPPQDLAVVVHVFYHDLWPEIEAALMRQDITFDLFVTVTWLGEDSDELVAAIREGWPNARIVIMPNHGRDIFPFVHLVNSGLLDPYRAIAKLHTKKSPHRQDGDQWRRHLISGILPGAGTRRLVERFLADPGTAFWVADGQFYRGTEWWGSNEKSVRRLLNRVEIRMDREDLAFPAGSMYWLKPLMRDMIRGLQLDKEAFEPEIAQVDGTLAHAFERTLGFIAIHAGQTVRQTTELERRKATARPKPRPRFTSAFYLPQFHPIPENDAWWGRGFTEWTAVTRAQSCFAGHAQPVLPSDLGFYDLRLPEVMAAQWQLAEEAGIDAFCVHHYWFDGRRVLEAPLDRLMGSPDTPFRFYLCWANESWRRNWDGLTGEVLLNQSYADDFEAALARDCLPYMRDPRYVRPDGTRPRFVIYRPEDLPAPAANVARLRAVWRELGMGEVELGAVHFHVEGENPVAPELFDFWVEMPPHGMVGRRDYLYGGDRGNAMGGLVDHTRFQGLIYDYEAVIEASLSPEHRAKLPDATIAGIMPSWDNTARRGPKAHIAYGANPASFDRWLRGLLQERLAGSYRNELFLNAWNEWAEKAMLEPSVQYGRANLDVLHAALRECR